MDVGMKHLVIKLITNIRRQSAHVAAYEGQDKMGHEGGKEQKKGNGILIRCPGIPGTPTYPHCTVESDTPTAQGTLIMKISHRWAD